MFAAAPVQSSAETLISSTSAVITTSATIAGNLVIVHIRIVSGTALVTSVTDNKGNAYILSSPIINGTITLYQAYGVQVIGAVTAITVNVDSSVSIRCGADEFSGLANSNATVIDQTATNTGTGTAMAVTLSPSAAGKLVVATIQNPTIGTLVAGTNYTRYYNNGTPTRPLISEYRLSATTSETAPATGPSGAWAEIARSFNLALIPWTYTQNFDSLTVGDLNGQDSWSGSVLYDIQTSVKYQGTKAVQGIGTNANMTRALTATDQGVMYFAMMKPDTISDASFQLMTGGNTAVRLQVTFQSGNITVTNGAGSSTVIAGYSTATFYLFEVTYNLNNTHSIRYHDGVSWSTPITALTAVNNGTIDGIRFNQGSTGTAYWDIITPTSPVTNNIVLTVDSATFTRTLNAINFTFVHLIIVDSATFTRTFYSVSVRTSGWNYETKTTSPDWTPDTKH